MVGRGTMGWSVVLVFCLVSPRRRRHNLTNVNAGQSRVRLAPRRCGTRVVLPARLLLLPSVRPYVVFQTVCQVYSTRVQCVIVFCFWGTNTNGPLSSASLPLPPLSLQPVPSSPNNPIAAPQEEPTVQPTSRPSNSVCATE